MPVYDPELGRVVVRIVYDGPGMAGKTTNLHKLSTIFSLARRSEMDSPEQTAGRTTYFDWLSIDSGLVHGHPLRTEFVTVPGQRVLARRRFALVDQADAIVFVVDSRPGRLAEAVQMLSVLRAHLDKTGRMACPLVVQLNKQDSPGATAANEARRALEIPDDTNVIGAEACNDLGVRETAVLAIRAAANIAQRTIVDEGLESIAGACSSAELLMEHLRRLEEGLQLTPAEILRGESEEIRASEEPPKVAPAEPVQQEAPLTEPPAPPDADVEVGCVWPPTQGRELLRRLGAQLSQLERIPSREDHQGFATLVTSELYLETGKSLCSTDLDTARKRLVERARTCLHLGDLLVDSTVLATCRAPDEKYWLWTLRPRISTLEEDLTSALESGDEDRARDVALKFAESVVRASTLAAQQGVLLRLDLACFGVQGDQIRYLDSRIALGSVLPDVAQSILALTSHFEGLPSVVDTYVDALATALSRELTGEELNALGLVRALHEKKPELGVIVGARDRLLSRLQEPSSA